MRKLALAVAVVAIAGLTVVAATALANRGHGGNGGNRFSAKLVGFEETPSESTPGSRHVQGDRERRHDPLRPALPGLRGG